LGEKVIFKPPLALLLPVTLRCSAKGQLEAVPRWTNTSGDLAGLLGTDGMVELPAAEEEFATGTLIPFRAW
jgi:molybdopterin molybdotransferase